MACGIPSSLLHTLPDGHENIIPCVYRSQSVDEGIEIYGVLDVKPMPSNILHKFLRINIPVRVMALSVLGELKVMVATRSDTSTVTLDGIVFEMRSLPSVAEKAHIIYRRNDRDTDPLTPEHRNGGLRYGNMFAMSRRRAAKNWVLRSVLEPPIERMAVLQSPKSKSRSS